MLDRDPLQMALDEAINHGANQNDLDRLRQYFRDIANNKSDDENVSTHIGDIPD
jgi:hypothetical protein